MTRDDLEDLQARVSRWVVECLGLGHARDRKERATRLVEEAMELAQSEGVDWATLEALLGRVYSRPAGNPMSEAGQVGVSLLAYAESSMALLGPVVELELQRIAKPEVMEAIRQKQRQKAAAGVGMDLP